MLRKRASALSYEPHLEQPVFEDLYHEVQSKAEGLLISKECSLTTLPAWSSDSSANQKKSKHTKKRFRRRVLCEAERLCVPSGTSD